MVTPATVLVVEEFPGWNTGTTWSQKTDFISDDAAIVAILLKRWGVQTGLICTTLGDDPAGRNTVQQLSDAGVQGDFRVSRDVETPFELNVSDRSGGRTYFWRRDPKVLATLDTADLSMIRGARLLYADWYDGDHALRALREAKRLDVPVFFNLEHGHEDSELLARVAPDVTICQAVTDAAQLQNDAMGVAQKLLDAGVSVALVTMAERGCLAATHQATMYVKAPTVDVVDGCAAGATLSAGYQFGLVKGWEMEECLRFAVAAASLQCTRPGPVAFPVAQVRALAASLEVGAETAPSKR
jgi:sugar/nucleoside kinase (ribokinase family)